MLAHAACRDLPTQTLHTLTSPLTTLVHLQDRHFQFEDVAEALAKRRLLRHLGLVDPTPEVVGTITGFYDQHVEARTLHRKWSSRAKKHVKKAKKRGRVRNSVVMSSLTLTRTLADEGEAVPSTEAPQGGGATKGLVSVTAGKAKPFQTVNLADHKKSTAGAMVL